MRHGGLVDEPSALDPHPERERPWLLFVDLDEPGDVPAFGADEREDWAGAERWIG